MRKLLIAVALSAATLTSGCGVLDNLNAQNSPAPLQNTTMDEKGLIYAYQSYDTLLILIDKAIDAKLIVPGTPRARSIKEHLITVKNALNAASAARKAGSVAKYNEAFDEATEALTLARLAINGGDHELH